MTNLDAAGSIPPSIRVELAHAAVCNLARRAGVDLLVVKVGCGGLEPRFPG